MEEEQEDDRDFPFKDNQEEEIIIKLNSDDEDD